MNKKKPRTSLSIAYDDACNDYAKAFAEKHEMDYSDSFWIGEDVGTILCIGDYSFNFQEIRYDIDYNIDKDEIIKYYDYCTRAYSLGFKKIMNYENWCKGCPRISEESFAKAEKYNKEIEEIKQELNRLIDEENNKRK
jgi:hypothetical protein